MREIHAFHTDHVTVRALELTGCFRKSLHQRSGLSLTSWHINCVIKCALDYTAVTNGILRV